MMTQEGDDDARGRLRDDDARGRLRDDDARGRLKCPYQGVPKKEDGEEGGGGPTKPKTKVAADLGKLLTKEGHGTCVQPLLHLPLRVTKKE